MRKNFRLGFFLMLTVFFTFRTHGQEFTEIAFASLQGSGTYSNPIIVGSVTKPTIITGCPGLSSGRTLSGRNLTVMYYRIILPQPPSENARAGAIVVPGGSEVSAVHPRITGPGGVVLLRSSANGFWIEEPNTEKPFGRFIPLAGLEPGTYMLSMEKLDSPLRSTQTPSYTIVIIP